MYHLAKQILSIYHFPHETEKTKFSNLDTIKRDQPPSCSGPKVFYAKTEKTRDRQGRDMTYQECHYKDRHKFYEYINLHITDY